MTDQLFTPEELNVPPAPGVPDLPPPGQERREVLAKRKDDLEELAETQHANIEAINPEVFKEDREIQNLIRQDQLNIDLGPNYKVKWVNCVACSGQAAWNAKADGWITLQYSMLTKPYQRAYRMLAKEDGSLRLGDVIAMFMRIDDYALLEAKREKARLRQQFGSEAEILELADKNPKAFKVLVGDDANESNSIQRLKDRAAKRMAVQVLSKKGAI